MYTSVCIYIYIYIYTNQSIGSYVIGRCLERSHYLQIARHVECVNINVGNIKLKHDKRSFTKWIRLSQIAEIVDYT